MFHQDRPSNAFPGPIAPNYLPRANDLPNVDAQQPCRDYGPPPQCPPRTYPTQSGSSALTSYSTPRSLHRMNWRVARDILTNQNVQVRIDGHGWVIGFALSALKFFEVISGVGCQVSYTLPNGQSGNGIFPEADVQPC